MYIIGAMWHREEGYMKFVKTREIKTGMRLARPIYNKNGVLLYERNSKVTEQAISSIENFGLLGIYILEPAEPVPPMSQEDLEFERFQTMMSFSLEEELKRIKQTGRAAKIQTIASMIIKNYANLNKKITFHQNLRSRENYTYRHSLNVAILCALITRVMNIKVDEQLTTITAALVHDMGKLDVVDDIADCDDLDDAGYRRLNMFEKDAFSVIHQALPNGVDVRRICEQSHTILESYRVGDINTDLSKFSIGAKILAVAGKYDSLTAMQLDKEPESEIKAFHYMLAEDHFFDPSVVNALLASINVLFPGVCVVLNNGEKGVVIKENRADIFRPLILCFDNNRVLDLSDDNVSNNVWINDVMKTLDNRYIFDTDTLVECGYLKPEEAYESADIFEIL